jgi:hypothetical protein
MFGQGHPSRCVATGSIMDRCQTAKAQLIFRTPVSNSAQSARSPFCRCRSSLSALIRSYRECPTPAPYSYKTLIPPSYPSFPPRISRTSSDITITTKAIILLRTLSARATTCIRSQCLFRRLALLQFCTLCPYARLTLRRNWVRRLQSFVVMYDT